MSVFDYFLHAWRCDSETGLRRLAELFATDGKRVRSLRSRGSFLTYEELEAGEIARQIVDAIDREWVPESRLMGFESLSDHQRVAIMHQADSAEANWAVIPCDEEHFPAEALASTAFAAADARRQHLVAGTEVVWRSGRPHVQAALEVRSWDNSPVEQLGGRLLEGVGSVELRSTVDRADEPDEIGLVESKHRRVAPSRTSEIRLEAEFPLDSVIFQNFRDDPTFQAWLVLEFDTEFICVPENWRRFWITVDLEES